MDTFKLRKSQAVDVERVSGFHTAVRSLSIICESHIMKLYVP